MTAHPTVELLSFEGCPGDQRLLLTVEWLARLRASRSPLWSSTSTGYRRH